MPALKYRAYTALIATVTILATTGGAFRVN